MCQVSGVTCQVSYVTCHISKAKISDSPFKKCMVPVLPVTIKCQKPQPRTLPLLTPPLCTVECCCWLWPRSNKFRRQQHKRNNDKNLYTSLALKAKSYVSKLIQLFVHTNYVVRPCNFCCVSMQIPSCVHANSVVRPCKWEKDKRKRKNSFPRGNSFYHF